MHIRKATADDREVLSEIWLRSVRATHTFLSEKDVEGLLPAVLEYVASTESKFWVVTSEAESVVGFMGMRGNRIESLFLLPEVFRKGYGRALLEHAESLHDELTVDVNEQNEQARAFYEAGGFVVEGSSEVDDAGRPFPLLHMRLKR